MRARRLLLGLGLAALLAGAPAQVASAATSDWPTYHRTNQRDGNDTSASPFSGIGQQWISAPLDGDIYAEPLVVGNQVIVATENNSLFSLDATTGAPTWAAPANFGTPVTVSGNSLFSPCGNISPLGITGTPVVDPVAGIVYAVAFVHGTTTDQYSLVAVNLSDGSSKFTPIPITPTGFDVYRQQQRGALVLANGYVYVPFGGYAGDCATYHGWVIGVKADGSTTTLRVFNDQPQPPCAGTTADEAGIWAPGGVAADSSGNLYVATGNGSHTISYDCGETVFKLSPTLGYLDSWAPTEWASLNGSDTDVGSVAPLLVASASMIFQTGKSGWGWLLHTSAMSTNASHIGGEAFNAPVCAAAISSNDPTVPRDQVFSGLAYADPYVYVPCPEGIKAVKLSGATFSIAWTTPAFHMEAPILSGGILWAIDTGSDLLRGFDPSTGTLKFTTTLGAQQHFPTPTAGQGRIYVADGAGPETIRAFGQGAGRYHPVTPTRLYDSRNGGGRLAAGATRDVPISGVGGIPSSGIAAAMINVTVTNTTAPSFLTVYPTGFQRPNTSNLNWTAGKTIANLVAVAIGDSGDVTVFNAAGLTDVILDLEGWISTPGPPAPDGLFNPLVPARILDTRDGTGGVPIAKIGAGQTVTVQVSGRGLVPLTGVTAVVLNVTATNPTVQSFLTVYPAGGSRPLTSNLNFAPGTTVPNRVVVLLGTGGKITIYNPAGSVDAIADVNGWFTDTTAGGTGSAFTGVAPTRILDTRDGTGGVSTPLGPGQTIALTVAGVGGVPPIGSTTPPRAVVLNVTVTGPTAASSILTLWPAGATRPGTSDLNFVAGQTVPNLTIVQVSATGTVDVYNALGSVQVIADVTGWYG